MRYMGGKMRIGKQLASVIQTYNPDTYAEPFCGMFSVGKHVDCRHKVASDIHPDLILLLQAVQAGWKPPTNITEEQYNQLKNAKPSALRGFVGFGCSFYGKFFGGFARDPSMNDFGTIARNNMLKLAPMIQGVEFRCRSYVDYEGDADVLYCDPPYAGTTDFSSRNFNTDDFWDWVRDRREIVLVSEYTAPKDFEVVWAKPVTTTMKDKTGRGCPRIEHLFHKKQHCVMPVLTPVSDWSLASCQSSQ
jgi:DNA adenine methylase